MYTAIDSLILDNNKEQNIFINVINQGIESNGLCDTYKNGVTNNNLKLLYRATRDGWEPIDWLNKCIGKENTIHLIHTGTDNVFGGFIGIKIPDDYGWHSDSKSFLILISSSENYKPQCYKMKNIAHPYVVYHDLSHVFIIGDYHIRIRDHANQEATSFTTAERENLYGIKADD